MTLSKTVAADEVKALINRVAIVIDTSGSMSGRTQAIVAAFDGLIAHLAKVSKDMNQETRVTVYLFDHEIRCLAFDQDVLRPFTLQGKYRPSGGTALLDATMHALTDFRKIPQLYGDHALLMFVLTDGQEEHSRHVKPDELRHALSTTAVNETVAILVPDIMAKTAAQRFGFPRDNIAIWDTVGVRGTEETVDLIASTTSGFMRARATGTRGSRALFTGGAQQVNATTVASLGLKPLDYDKYTLTPIPTIPDKTQIHDYVTKTLGLPFHLGRNFYQLSKPEKIQAGKQIALLEKGTDRVYVGREARSLLGLPDHETRVQPDHNTQYTVFVQSNSMNRHLVPHTKLLILK